MVLVVLVARITTSGIATSAERAKVSASLLSDGTGQMIANSQTNPADESWYWEVCAAGLTSCRSFADGRIVNTAGAPANSVFRATSSYGASALSPLWRGTISRASPPSVKGIVRANEPVTPTAGRWNGGWKGEYGEYQLAACASRSVNHCITLTDPHYPESCEDSAAYLDPAFVGRFLRVAEARVGAGPHLRLDYGVATPYSKGVWKKSPVVAAAYVGRIKPATRGRTADCGPPPLIEASISTQGTAKVSCGLGCRATLLAAETRQSFAHIGRTIPRPKSPASTEPVSMQFPEGTLENRGPGPIRIILEVNGRQQASRTIVG